MVRDVDARRGPGAGRARRRARAVAGDRHPGQPGRLAHGRREASRDRRAAPPRDAGAQAGADRRESWRCSSSSTSPISTRRSTTCRTTCCAWCSSRAIRSCLGEARVALTLRLLGGLTTAEIARAFLVSEGDHRAAHRARQAHAHRGARALRGAPRSELDDRLSSVLEVIYLVFNEGYAATAGDDWMRPALCEDALRLGRDPRRAGAARARGPRTARADGAAGVAAAARVSVRAASRSCSPIRTAHAGTSCSCTAASAALRARRSSAARSDPTRCRPRSPPAMRGLRAAEETDWPRIVALYDAPGGAHRSPVVELNRAVAVAMAFGPEAGLELVDALAQRARVARLPPAAERAWRPPRPARTARRGARRVRARRGHMRQRTRAHTAALTRGRLRYSRTRLPDRWRREVSLPFPARESRDIRLRSPAIVVRPNRASRSGQLARGWRVLLRVTDLTQGCSLSRSMLSRGAVAVNTGQPATAWGSKPA